MVSTEMHGNMWYNNSLQLTKEVGVFSVDYPWPLSSHVLSHLSSSQQVRGDTELLTQTMDQKDKLLTLEPSQLSREVPTNCSTFWDYIIRRLNILTVMSISSSSSLQLRYKIYHWLLKFNGQDTWCKQVFQIRPIKWCEILLFWNEVCFIVSYDEKWDIEIYQVNFHERIDTFLTELTVRFLLTGRVSKYNSTDIQAG